MMMSLNRERSLRLLRSTISNSMVVMLLAIIQMRTFGVGMFGEIKGLLSMCIWFKMVKSMMLVRCITNDTIFTGEETKTKSLTFDVAIPTTINKEGAFDVMALCYVESSLSDGNIECKVDLKRNGTMPLWDNCQLSSMETDGKSYSLSTNESLNVHNTTSDTITVKHKGFEAKDKWYYSKANVVLTADRKVSASGSSTGEEDVSRVYKVAPGHYVTLWSFYVPTGKKMKDARLVLEINGKDVRTQPISSDVNIELGQFYRMAVRWDGKSLKWLLGNGETRGLNGKDMFSNADIISCGDPSTDF